MSKDGRNIVTNDHSGEFTIREIKYLAPAQHFDYVLPLFRILKQFRIIQFSIFLYYFIMYAIASRKCKSFVQACILKLCDSACVLTSHLPRFSYKCIVFIHLQIADGFLLLLLFVTSHFINPQRSTLNC